MIEIPESTCLAKQLNETLTGKKITAVISMQNPHKLAFIYKDPAEYPGLLIGKGFSEAMGHGSWVTMVFEDAEFMVSEGTKLFYTEDERKLTPKHQMLIRFDDGSYLVASVQMYGGVVCAEKGDYDNEYYLLSLIKPSVISEDFDEMYFNHLFSSKTLNMSVKGFLATEQRIPGLGNGVLQDILFRAGIHPGTKLRDLSPEMIQTLYKAVKSTIREMIDAGGRDTERDLFGQPGNYKTLMSKNTAGSPCPRCGALIEKSNYMGGSIYFCRVCQPLSGKEK